METVIMGLVGNVFFWTLLVSLLGGYFTLRQANHYRDQAAFVEFPETPERYNRWARILVGFFTVFLIVIMISLTVVIFQVLQVTRPQLARLSDPASTATMPAVEMTASPSPTPGRVFFTATPRPTRTSTPTPALASDTGLMAKIGNTDFQGVNVRAIPSLDGKVLARLVNRTIVEVLDVPAVTADGYTWQQVLLEDGTEGWVADQFLLYLPTPAVTQQP